MHGCFELTWTVFSFTFVLSFLLLFGYLATFTSNLGSSLFLPLHSLSLPFLDSMQPPVSDKKRSSCWLTFSLNHFLSEHFPDTPYKSPYAYGKTLPQTHSSALAHEQVGKHRHTHTHACTHRKRKRLKHKISHNAMKNNIILKHIKKQLKFTKKDKQPKESYSVTSLCSIVPCPYDLNPSRHHIICTTSYSSALKYIIVNPSLPW